LYRKSKHILRLVPFFPSFHEWCRLWDDFEKWCRAGEAADDNIWRKRYVCWITKATHSHSEYVLIAFPLQQWLQERGSVLRYSTMPAILNVFMRQPNDGPNKGPQHAAIL
jgi:hypothetical protein